MKVTSQDIRNLAEALPILKKHMHLHPSTISKLYDCIEMAVEDFKKRLLYEGLEEDGEEAYEPDFDDEEEETENDD